MWKNSAQGRCVCVCVVLRCASLVFFFFFFLPILFPVNYDDPLQAQLLAVSATLNSTLLSVFGSVAIFPACLAQRSSGCPDCAPPLGDCSSHLPWQPASPGNPASFSTSRFLSMAQCCNGSGRSEDILNPEAVMLLPLSIRLLKQQTTRSWDFPRSLILGEES